MSDEEYELFISKEGNMKKIEIITEDKRIEETINLKRRGTCFCVYTHVLNDILYDMVILVNDKLVGIDFSNDLSQSLKDICKECNIPLYQYMHLFVEFYQMFIRLVIKDNNELNLYYHGGTKRISINDDYKNIRMSTNGLVKNLSNELFEQYEFFIKFYSLIDEMCKIPMNKIFDVIESNDNIEIEEDEEEQIYEKEMKQMFTNYSNDLDKCLNEICFTEEIDINELKKKIDKKREQRQKQQMRNETKNDKEETIVLNKVEK